jgi:AI-2 transport protein TqsA
MTTETKHPVFQTLLALACLVVISAGVKAAQVIVVPFLLALLLALILSPLMSALIKRSVPAGVAIMLALVLLVITGGALAIILGSSINDFVRDLPQFQHRLNALTARAFDGLTTLGLEKPGDYILETFNPGSVLKFAGTALASLSGLMTNAFLILLTTTFLLGEGLVLNRKMHAALGEEDRTHQAFEQIATSIKHYMGLKSIVSLGTGAVVVVWLWILGVDYAVMWGLLAFLLNFIPNVGSLIAAVPAVLFALVQLGPLSAVLAAAGYLGINTLLGSIIEPRIMGQGLDLSPLVVFVSLIFWGFLLGPVGMLLSVPLTVVVKLILESSASTHWIAILLGGSKPANTPV